MANWRRWGPILFGVGVLLFFLAIGGVLFGVSWMREHVVVEDAAASSADAHFEEVRKRFADKAPLVEIRRSGTRRNVPPEDAPRMRLATLHVLAWDPDDEKIARVQLPFWLLRLKETPIQFGSYASGLDEIGVTLTAAEIERYGPGIVVDVEMSRGERALIWAE
jgi:hypothetical protein